MTIVKINLWHENAGPVDKAGKIRYCFAESESAKTLEGDWKTLPRGTREARRLLAVLDLMEPVSDRNLHPDKSRYYLSKEEWDAIVKGK